MSRQIQVQQPHTNNSGIAIYVTDKYTVEADIDKVQQDSTLGAPKMCRYPGWNTRFDDVTVWQNYSYKCYWAGNWILALYTYIISSSIIIRVAQYTIHKESILKTQHYPTLPDSGPSPTHSPPTPPQPKNRHMSKASLVPKLILLSAPIHLPHRPSQTHTHFTHSTNSSHP